MQRPAGPASLPGRESAPDPLVTKLSTRFSPVLKHPAKASALKAWTPSSTEVASAGSASRSRTAGAEGRGGDDEKKKKKGDKARSLEMAPWSSEETPEVLPPIESREPGLARVGRRELGSAGSAGAGSLLPAGCRSRVGARHKWEEEAPPAGSQ